jgi:hypothetical protein
MDIQENFMIKTEFTWRATRFLRAIVDLVRTKIDRVPVKNNPMKIEAFEILENTEGKVALENQTNRLGEENEVLNSYYSEGLKLFNQGEYAKHLVENKDKLGIYL